MTGVVSVGGTAQPVVSPVLNRTRIVVATTVLLSFISFWRAAAIVLNDLGSSAYYAAGIAERAFGKSAPWFILAVMLFSYAVRAVYIESCVMFVRGGVYRTVKEAMGGTLGKLAVSALLFDYLLTGPISVVSAGQYLGGLINDLLLSRHLIDQPMAREPVAVLFAAAVTVYFWRKNVQGLHASSERSLQIMYLVTVMVVIILGWAGLTLYFRGGSPVPPWPSLQALHFTPDALGWFEGTSLPRITLIAFFIAFGHSVLAMSGEETLAQVSREIEHPKLLNLKRTGLVVFAYSLLFTAAVSFLGVMLIPDAERPKYFDNLIGGLAMHMSGPQEARLALQAFVVFVGVVMLAGAVNTAIIGSNGVLNRVAEDGILTDWFRHPHAKFGTTNRIISMIAFLQLAIILGSRGNVYMLGEAYAFGVIWSFTMMAASIVVLRFKRSEHREWRVPGNLRVGRLELPVGVAAVATILLSTALTNLVSKKIATVWGITFTVLMFALFTVSEKITARRRAAHAGVDQFQLHNEEVVTCDVMKVRPGCVLVPVRDYQTLEHLQVVLERTDTQQVDVVVMTTRLIRGADFAGEFEAQEHLFSEYEELLFSRVVGIAEKAGKTVSLLVVPGTNPFAAILLTAQHMKASAVVMGRSNHISVQEQARLAGNAWENLPMPRPHLDLEIITGDGPAHRFFLGPHAPEMRPQDVELLHRLWLELSTRPDLKHLHHDQVIAVALRRFAAGLRRGAESGEILQELKDLAGPPDKKAGGGTTSNGS